MLSRPLVLVLGAGSSRDFGPANIENRRFPLGEELRTKIAKALDIDTDEWGNYGGKGSETVFGAYKEASKFYDENSTKAGALRATGSEMALALPGCDSIDDLLERHSSNISYRIVGKLGIAECILRAERDSPLRQDPSRIQVPSIAGFSNHWLSNFLRAVTRRCSLANLSAPLSNLKVVNFNYDRCFEHFTQLWLRHVYPMTEGEALKIMRNIEIIHPYGSLGNLPDGTSNCVPFGYEPHARELLKISQNILTYSESVEDDGRPEKIKQMTWDCDQVIFLGFAFHAQNMNLLNWQGTGILRNVYATNVKMAPPKWERAKERIFNILGQSEGNTRIYDSSSSCEDLIDDHIDRWSE